MNFSAYSELCRAEAAPKAAREDVMNTNLSAAELRRWAEQCEARSRDSLATAQETERLLKMRDALLVLADNQEWLDGHKAPLAMAG
jgi:arsenate reductase-like glutaredoxin family protein